MRFGVGRDLITPPFRMNMGGYDSRFGDDFAGVHDDLYVKALLLDDGRQRALFITHDLVGNSAAFLERMTEYAGRRHGISPACVVASCTHTHAGPMREPFPGQWATGDYDEFLWERTCRCVDRACMATHEGEMSYGVAEGDWTMNRRARIDGAIRNAPNPTGPVDRSLGILRITGGRDAPGVLLLNYACHPVTLGDTRWISSECPGRLCQRLEAELYGTTALFFQGAGANSRPRVAAATATTWKNCTFGEVDAMATEMAGALRSALSGGRLRPVRLDLAAVRFHLDLPLDVQCRETIVQSLAREAHPGQRVRLQDILDQYDLTGDGLRLHAGIVRLDDSLFAVWMGGEVCVEVKRVIEKVFERRDLIFIGYAHSAAYIPTDALIEEGGYESGGAAHGFRLKGPVSRGIDAQVAAAFGAAFQCIHESSRFPEGSCAFTS